MVVGQEVYSESKKSCGYVKLPALLSTVIHDRSVKATTVRLTNLTPQVTTCPAHLRIVVWIPHGTLPRDEIYIYV